MALSCSKCFTNEVSCLVSGEKIVHNWLVWHKLVVLVLMEKYITAVFICMPMRTYSFAFLIMQD